MGLFVCVADGKHSQCCSFTDRKIRWNQKKIYLFHCGCEWPERTLFIQLRGCIILFLGEQWQEACSGGTWGMVQASTWTALSNFSNFPIDRSPSGLTLLNSSQNELLMYLFLFTYSKICSFKGQLNHHLPRLLLISKCYLIQQMALLMTQAHKSESGTWWITTSSPRPMLLSNSQSCGSTSWKVLKSVHLSPIY